MLRSQCGLFLLLLCFGGRAATSQAVPASQPSGRDHQLFSCGDWTGAGTKIESTQDLDKWLDEKRQDGSVADHQAQVVETVKLPYLNGLQYGYLTAVEDAYRFLSSQSASGSDNELPTTWATLLSPRSDISWTNVMGAINAFCANTDNTTKDVAEAAVTVLNETGARIGTMGSEARRILFTDFGCSQYNEHPRTIWLALTKAGLPDKVPAWKNFLSGLAVHQFELPPGKELSGAIGGFCADARNANIPFVFAAKIAARQARGENEDADSLLEHFYCSDLQPVWANGRQMKGKTCLGIIVFVTAKPVLEKPFGFMVGIVNTSQTNIEVDWSQWSLAWTGRKGPNLNPALDPDKVAHSIERRSTLAASLAAFGASMSANTPQRAVVTGPQGTSTVTIYPQAGQASAAATQAAATTAKPGMELARTLSDSSLRRTTLFPGSQTGGGMVYFGRPKDESGAAVQVHIPGLPMFSIEVDTK